MLEDNTKVNYQVVLNHDLEFDQQEGIEILFSL